MGAVFDWVVPGGAAACKTPASGRRAGAGREAVGANRCSFLTGCEIPAAQCAVDHSRHGRQPVAKQQVVFAYVKGGVGWTEGPSLRGPRVPGRWQRYVSR